jgi:hypothetical protein
MRDCAAIANNVPSVIAGPVYTKEIPPFATQIYSVDQSMNIVMINAFANCVLVVSIARMKKQAFLLELI